MGEIPAIDFIIGCVATALLHIHFLLHTAWWWLLCAAKTCSCYWICYNKNCVLTDYVLIVCSTGTVGISHLKITRESDLQMNMYLCLIKSFWTNITCYDSTCSFRENNYFGNACVLDVSGIFAWNTSNITFMFIVLYKFCLKPLFFC